MKHLTAFVDRQNSWNTMFGKPGELSRAQITDRHRYYLSIISDIEKYCKDKGYVVGRIYSEF